MLGCGRQNDSNTAIQSCDNNSVFITTRENNKSKHTRGIDHKIYKPGTIQKKKILSRKNIENLRTEWYKKCVRSIASTEKKNYNKSY